MGMREDQQIDPADAPAAQQRRGLAVVAGIDQDRLVFRSADEGGIGLAYIQKRHGEVGRSLGLRLPDADAAGQEQGQREGENRSSSLHRGEREL